MANDIYFGGVRVGGALTANTTVNFTSGMTAAVMQALINAQPKNLNGYNLIFQFATVNGQVLTSALTFSNFYGGGYVFIQGNTSEANATVLHTTQDVYLDFSSGTTAGIVISSCESPVQVRNLKIKISDTSLATCVSVQKCFWVDCLYNYCLGAAKTTSWGVWSTCSNLQIAACYFDNLHICEFMQAVMLLYSSGNSVTGTTSDIGLYAATGTTIAKGGVQPAATTPEGSETGGIIR